MVDQKATELKALQSKMVKLHKQLDDEQTRRDIAQADAVALQGRVQELSDGTGYPSQVRGKGIAFQ